MGDDYEGLLRLPDEVSQLRLATIDLASKCKLNLYKCSLCENSVIPGRLLLYVDFSGNLRAIGNTESYYTRLKLFFSMLYAHPAYLHFQPNIDVAMFPVQIITDPPMPTSTTKVLLP